MAEGVEFEIAGQELVANPNGTLYWPAEETLFVADVHLGKAAAFRARSVPLPHGTTALTMTRLDRAVRECGCRRFVILGDLWHDKLGHTKEREAHLSNWRGSYPAVEFVLITGNHDRKAGVSLVGSGFLEADELRMGPFLCRHHPEVDASGYVLAGHIHPAACMEGPGARDLRLPCFWFGPKIGVLPAFGEFTGSALVEPARGDFVFVLASDQVISVGRDPVRMRS